MRTPFDLGLEDELIIDLHGEHVAYGKCAPFARVMIPHATITDEVLRAPDGRYLRLTTVADEASADTVGRMKGWYAASWIEQRRAEQLREAWARLEPQPTGRR